MSADINNNKSLRDQLNAKFANAPIVTIPTSRRLTAIEYPSPVKSIPKAIGTLGGLDRIADTFNRAESNPQFELRFRPKDPFGHPILGDVIQTSNICLKVYHRKASKGKEKMSRSNATSGKEQFDDSQDWLTIQNGLEMKTEVLGFIFRTGRFRGM